MSAYKEEKLAGWLLLFVHDPKKLEINPWVLGGHPLVLLDEHHSSDLSQLLLAKCIDYALQNNYTRIELSYAKKDNPKEYPVDPSVYPQVNLMSSKDKRNLLIDLVEECSNNMHNNTK